MVVLMSASHQLSHCFSLLIIPKFNLTYSVSKAYSVLMFNLLYIWLSQILLDLKWSFSD